MKIDNSTGLLPFVLGWGEKPRSPTASSESNMPSATNGTRKDVVTISSQLRSMGGTAMPIDASKLAEIKQAISEGRIQINSSAVAGSLIRSVADLISAQ